MAVNNETEIASIRARLEDLDAELSGRAINVHRSPPTATPFIGRIEGNYIRILENSFKFNNLTTVFNSLPATKNQLVRDGTIVTSAVLLTVSNILAALTYHSGLARVGFRR
jgi:hypothetical protein